jgi:hypothetical protein
LQAPPVSPFHRSFCWQDAEKLTISQAAQTVQVQGGKRWAE